ncbi:uncharacterized protein BJ212DRAFT_460083 [Suillus subaureus]|uniref:Uncharacterized protein n=1 Tax=Suillus subaureus TaxID=48587 RepID=A0A9P7E725_9AGAM|nr:uncharacterized protein BJ212DRAFT_460083 [Suillus subaureus]KAG1812612.1 hypothetical protein BJ212DRAFT_460083 [Suillus subaureus]
MEELPSTGRRIYREKFNSSTHTLGGQSTLSLRGHAAPIAGTGSAGVQLESDPFADPFARTTPAGNAPVHQTEAAVPQPEGQPADTHAATVPVAAPRLPLYKRRWFIIISIVGACLGIALLFIILFPVLRAIVQHVINQATLNIQQAAILSPSNTSFTLVMLGVVSHTGIFSATVAFSQPVNVSWMNGSVEVPLGYMSLSTLYASNKRATINDTTTFYITDQNAFGRFTSSMITSQNFTWKLQSSNLNVQAMKFPTAHGISFNKLVTINGINNFAGNVILEDMQLPSDNPGGGIDFVAVTQLNNTSPFALGLGTVVFDLVYQNVYLGTGTGFNTNIVPGPNNITLNGTLVPQTTPANLATVSQLFTNYINFESSPVIAMGKSTLQPDGSQISWLSQGLESLQLVVPFKSTTPINPIRSIQIGSMALAFTPETAWTPRTDSNSVHATMQLPFGFGLSIDQIQNEFTIVKNGSNVAGLNTPLGASTSSITVLSPTDTEGTINITILNSVLNATDPEHDSFATFNMELTDSTTTDFLLVGNSRAVANTSIGQITLDPIKVNVSTSLNGLQGLKGCTTIGAVDVMGGTQQALNLSIDVSIYNPSNLDLATGDLQLQLQRGGAILGTALMPNLTMSMGNNSVHSTSAFDPNNSPEGLQTLSQFVGGQDVELNIVGYSGSTQVASLLEAFESMNITVTLPGLNSSLLSTGSLEILPTTFVTNNISQVTVALVNPFTAGFDITSISSNVTSHGLYLGSINTATNFNSAGKSTTKSPVLNMTMNYDPPTLFTLTRVLAMQAGLDPTQLDGIVALGDYQYVTATTADSEPVPQQQRRANIYTEFNLPNFVDQAFKQLRSDIQLSSQLTIGNYATTLSYTQTDVPISTDSSLNLILPILAKPIVQKVVGGSVLGVESVLITNPQETMFGTQLNGSITNAGPFDATITFNNGLTVSWGGQPIGVMKMDPVNVVGDVGATLNVQTTFEVANADYLANFTKVMLNNESFEWDISGDNLTVSALGIEVSGISLPSKAVTLKGFNGLKNGVVINSFDLPFNDPAGGIHLTINSEVINPSQVGIELSSLAFNTYANGIEIAPVSSTSTVTLAPNSTSSLELVGRLIPQNSLEGLVTVSDIFNNYIHGMDSQVTVYGAGAGPSDVTWLNEGIQTLQVVTSLPNKGKLNVIQSIDLEQLSLMFTEATAYDPMSGSNLTTAAFTLPFAFPVDITALAQNITAGYNGQSFAELVIPRGPSSTDVQNRIIYLTFSDVPFAVYSDQHETFQDFIAATTLGSSQTLALSGAANADASTAVGVLSLVDIEFSVQSTIAGLQGLKAKPASVANLDVNHGYSDYLLITVDTSLFNPSNLTIGTGDVSFALQFENQVIGSADLSNMIIQPGNVSYPTDVHYSPQGAAQTAAGQAMLENYLQGVDSQTTIMGTSSSTSIGSLEPALAQINLSPVTIPALHQNLIGSASLEFPTDIIQTGVAWTTFTLANPFTASINLLEVTAIATYHNLTLGAINHVDMSSNPIHADGHSNITSPVLPFNFNLDPLTIIGLITTSAQEHNVDLGPLTSLFQLVIDNPSFHPPVNTLVDISNPTCVSGNQFDINDAILNALKGLQVTLAVDSSVKLDDYPTNLAFNQYGVSAITDKTSLYLIGAVGGPITQDLVNGATLAFNQANITDITNEGFQLSLQGSLTNVGPLDALIEFVEPVTVTWQGHNIATIALPPVCSAANTGVPNYNTQGQLVITDQVQFTSFATYLLHNPSFDWTISTSSLKLTALGTIFNGVSMSKTVTLKAFNGLPGVTISNFQLPSDDPAGGITISTDSIIPSPAQLGIDLGNVGFQAYFENTRIGPLTASDLVLLPESSVTSHLSGQMIPQSGSGLSTIGKLFSEYLAADNITLNVQGDTVQPSGANGPVTWLSTAFKTLTLDVILPGKKFDIIQSITLSDLSLTMQSQDQAFSPLSGSNNTVAQYKNPFGFSLQVIQSTVNMDLSYGGTAAAQLNLPQSNNIGGVSTGNLATLPISFHNVPLTSVNNGAFEAMFAQVTDKNSADLGLSGTVDVTAKTTIGDVPISGIAFDVTSSLAGMNSFDGKATITNISISGSGGNGGNQYIISPLTSSMNNPSNVSLDTVDIALPVYYQDVMIGRAAFNPFNLVPGEDTIPGEFHYEPANPNDTVAEAFLTSFLQTGNSLPITIQGDSASTPFASLQSALEGVTLTSSVTGLNVAPIISHLYPEITLATLVTNEINLSFDVTNPLDAELEISFVQADGLINGEIYAHLDQAFSSFVIPPKQTVNSGKFGNVKLVKGALASLPIIPLGYLDIQSVVTTRAGSGGYQIPWLHINQNHVTASYDLGVSLADLSSAGQSMTATTSLAGPTVMVPPLSAVTAGLGSSTPSSGAPASAAPGPSGSNPSTPPLPTSPGNTTIGPL